MSAGTLLFFLDTDFWARGLFALVTKGPRMDFLLGWITFFTEVC